VRTANRVPWVRLTIASVMLSAAVSPAFAATSRPSLASLSMRVDAVDSALLVSGQVAVTVKLPATISLPVPSGATPYWVGEILGGDPSKDPRATYSIVKAKGYDLVVFTIKQSRTAQAEVTIRPTAASGGPVTLSYSLPVPLKVAVASLAFQLAAGSTVGSSTPGLIGGQSTTGQPLLTETVQNPKVGSVISGSVSFTPAALAAAPPLTTSGDSSNVLVVLLWILAAGIAGLFGKAVFDRRAAAGRVDASDEGSDTDDAEEDFAFEDDPPVRNTRVREQVTAQKTGTPVKRAQGSKAVNGDAETPAPPARKPGASRAQPSSTGAAQRERSARPRPAKRTEDV
jgi:hypothetical protein